MKKSIKIVEKVVMVFLISISILTPISNAGFFGDVVKEGNRWIRIGKSGENQMDYGAMEDAKDTLYSTFFTIGVAISVIYRSNIGNKIYVIKC